MADELVFTLSIKDNATPQLDAFTRKIKGMSADAQKEFGAFRDKFNSSFGDFGKAIDSAEQLRSVVGGLAGSFAALGVQKAGEFVVDSVKNFAAYESALVSVQRTMGLTKTELDSLGESLRTLALTDLKGQVVADDLAVIAEVAGSLGVAKTDLLDFTKNVAMVATATDQSMEKVATSFGKIANVFKGSLGEDAYTKIGAIGSAFDKLADDMAATVPGMLDFVNRMGGVASSMGLTVDQTAALAATLESVGLPAERGATAMNNVMLTLMKNSKSFAEALSIDADKLASALKEKPVEALQMVLKAMEELGQTKGQDELLRVMEDLMGKGNGVTEVVLKMQTAQTDFATALGKSNQAFDEATRAGESFNQAASTQEASWKSISTAVDDLSKSLGQQLKPATEGASQGLALLATDFANTFRADTINQFFDDVVSGFADLGSANLTEWLTAIPTAAVATVADLRGIVTGGITDILGGISEMIGAGDWFAGLVTDAKKALGEVKAIIADAFGGGVSDEEYAKEMENIFSAQEIGIQNVTAAMGEKTAATQADLDALVALKMGNLELLRTNQDLRAEYQAVATELGAAVASGQAPTQELIEATERLKTAMAEAGGETKQFDAVLSSMSQAVLGADDALEGHSLTPALRRYIEAALASGSATGELTAEMRETMQGVLEADAAYKQLEGSLNQNQRAIIAVEKEMQGLKQSAINASDYGKKQIAEEIKALQVKRSELMLQKKDIQYQMDLKREEIDLGKDAVKVFKDQQKAAEDAAKARTKANEELAKNTQRTAELIQKQKQDEMKAANDLYREQQKQAADSIKWVNNLGDATKKRILGEKDAVKILQEQGVKLTDLQVQEVRRMQAAYKTEAAYDKQLKALEAQLDPMGALIAAGEQLSGSLGELSSGVGSIGDLFGFDTSGIENILGKAQQLAELPQTIAGIKDAVSGIGEAFGKLKDFDLSKIFSGGGGLSGILSSLGSIAPIAGIIMSAWEPIKDFFGSLFENTKSKGTEAAEAFQDFVAKNISGGAEMEAALKTNFDAMSAAGFDYQQFLQQTGTTMDQTFGGISANWEQGATAMDIFTQAVGKATGDMQKAPQVALQMIASFQDMGMSAEEAGAKMIEMATAAGMSSGQIDALRAALAAATGGAAALDDELVGHSLVPSLQALNDIAGVSATPLAALGATAAQTAAQTAQASANVDGLKAALVGGAEEGEATGSVFDSAAQSVTTLNAQTMTLSGSLSTVTTQLSGTGAAGASTSDIFAQAQASAGSLTTTTSQLSGDLSSLTGQLTGTGAETLATSNLFTLAGGSAVGLQGDVNNLDGQVTTANDSLAETQKALAAIPDQKTVTFTIKTVGSVPKMATGGTVGAMGMAIVNERGSEIAKFPGGGMALMQSRGAMLGAFPAGTEIIPHGQSMSLLSRFPGIPRMATGGTITGSGGTVINVNITGNNITKDTDLKALARQVSAEISRNYNAMR